MYLKEGSDDDVAQYAIEAAKHHLSPMTLKHYAVLVLLYLYVVYCNICSKS